MVSHIARIEHADAHQALDNELGLEEILAVLSKALLAGRREAGK